MCSCILSSWENGIPLNKLFTLGRRRFNGQNESNVLKHAESHRCEVNASGTFACNFSTFLTFLKRTHFEKLPTESERSDRFWPGKFLKIIEHVSYLIKYSKLSFFIYSGSSSLSNAGCFFFLTHPVEFSDWTGNPLLMCENVAVNLNRVLRLTRCYNFEMFPTAMPQSNDLNIL